MTKLIKVKYDDLTEVAQSAPQAVEFEEIASGSVDLPVSTNKSIFLDSLDQEFKAIDSLGVVSTFGGSAGGLQPVFIDHTGIPAELIRDRIYEADFSGATAGSTLTVTFPEGTGAETFIIGFRITGLSENSSVTFQTTNSQNIFFPDGTTDTSLTGVNTPTYLEFAWDQSRYVYGDVYDPTYIDARGLFENDDQVLTEAGEISSTSQDTTLWPTVNGNKVKKGKLALSTSASTTITNAQTVYPELWANSPAAWQSGSDLIIPQQTDLGNQSYGFIASETGGIVSQTGGLIASHVKNATGNYTVTYTRTLNTKPIISSTIVDGSGTSIGSTLRGFTDTVNGFSYTIHDDSQVAYDAGAHFNLELDTSDRQTENKTPTISLYNNLVPTSLTIDLPEATSNVAGAVRKNKSQVKTLTSDVIGFNGTISDLSFNNLVIGRRYRVEVSVIINNAVGDGSCTIKIQHDGVDLGLLNQSENTTSSSKSLFAEFDATTTTVEIIAGSFDATSFIDGGADKRSKSRITELNNYESETTDFT